MTVTPQAPPIFGYDNRFDEATVAAGSNEAGLAALFDRALGEAWESADAATASTWISGTFAYPVSIALAGLFGINVGVHARYRFRAWSDTGASDLIFDTGTLDICPVLTPLAARSWGRLDFWTGKPPARDWKRLRRKIVVPLADSTQVRAWRFDIEDEANEDGLVRISRPFLGDAIQPGVGLDLGYELAMTPYFQAAVAPSGARDVSETRPGLRARGTLSWLTEGERGRFLDAQVLVGATGEVVWIPHPDDPALIQRDAMLGILGQPRPPRRARNDDEPHTLDIEVQEWM